MLLQKEVLSFERWVDHPHLKKGSLVLENIELKTVQATLVFLSTTNIQPVLLLHQSKAQAEESNINHLEFDFQKSLDEDFIENTTQIFRISDYLAHKYHKVVNEFLEVLDLIKCNHIEISHMEWQDLMQSDSTLLKFQTYRQSLNSKPIYTSLQNIKLQ